MNKQRIITIEKNKNLEKITHYFPLKLERVHSVFVSFDSKGNIKKVEIKVDSLPSPKLESK